ncbi:GMC family oxidoreductase [Shimia sagamensis]|uniref:Choline dehydrogenase n=1 Tax=Shimia sagamensis TaxID=1566352 RepID=A0ABY1PJT5_9RHOB|nr:GMC family oxidoreductase [Shimia sagamensis]SMP34309.1 Choline dehydrogenase [Shimia sagamensis]
MTADPDFDVVIVGAGFSGAIMAKILGSAGKRVLLLDSGPHDTPDRVTFQNAYLSSDAKLPNAPYPPYERDPSRQAAPRAMTAMTLTWPSLSDMRNLKTVLPSFNRQSYLTYTDSSEIPFLSTYERIVGGTSWHWLGTALRFDASDFEMKSRYNVMVDWPLKLTDLFDDYAQAEKEIGVSANVEDQRAMEKYLGVQFPPGYEYPMGRIPMSVSDKVINEEMKGLTFDGHDLEMTCTPQGRNSAFRNGRPACRGNSSCVPICPIHAKYDSMETLQDAMATGNVELVTQAVVTDLEPGPNGIIRSLNYLVYEEANGHISKQTKSVTAKVFVLAAHAIETVKILQMSNNRKGIANKSDQVGRNLMDHLCYLGWGLSNTQGFPYRGPRSGSGIETLRDGPFRARRSAWRVDVGNVGWEWADDDPATSLKDFVNGTNNSRLNPAKEQLFGAELVERLNHFNTRMMRLCYLVEQEPMQENRITLSDTHTDGLGLPRPLVNYRVTDSELTLRGIAAAEETTDLIFDKVGKNYSRFIDGTGYPAIKFNLDGQDHKANLYGAGHIVGTYRMGTDDTNSVVDNNQRCWEHRNLFLLGSGSFPTIATGNPTLTLVALTFRTSRSILADLD